jgi:16S rRNA (adenine1518-N6/adenine1519-N6)-dimethyltransferase
LRNEEPDIEQSLLFRTVKVAFNQRRKKLRNALQQFQLNDSILQQVGFIDKRAEELSISDFIHLSKLIEQHGKTHD